MKKKAIAAAAEKSNAEFVDPHLLQSWHQARQAVNDANVAFNTVGNLIAARHQLRPTDKLDIGTGKIERIEPPSDGAKAA